MRNFVYIRTTNAYKRRDQYEKIMKKFKDEINDLTVVVISENKSESRRVEEMIESAEAGDVLYCYTPAMLGITIEKCVENQRKLLEKCVTIRTYSFGDISSDFVDRLQVLGDVVRECFEIEMSYINAQARGAQAQKGGYFRNGVWMIGRNRLLKTPEWAFSPQQRAFKNAVENEVSPARQWVEYKVMQGLKVDAIWKEYRVLCKLLPEDQWERFEKTWIANHRRELLR